MYIIIGLGNPGREYTATRHNIGFDAITRISDDYKIKLDFKKHKAVCGKGQIAGEKVILAQPQTYMNLSGVSVRELMDYYKATNKDIIVIYDDTSLDAGQLRIREKGSAGGHNGIKSIISSLSSDEFLRIKIGIGEKPRTWDLADYVLSRFSTLENELMKETLEKASKACFKIITEGVASAMNEFNHKSIKKGTS